MKPTAEPVKHNINKGGLMNSMRMFTYNVKQANTSTVIGIIVLAIAVILLIYYFKNKGGMSNVKINEIKYDFF
jgi:C4-dicarboxylate transporter